MRDINCIPLLSDADIELLFQEIPLRDLLNQFKTHRDTYIKQYPKETARIKRADMRESSDLVKKFLPNIAAQICMKGDTGYIELANKYATSLSKALTDRFVSIIGDGLDEERLSLMTEADYRKLFQGLSAMTDDQVIDRQRFLLTLKILDIDVSEEQRNRMESASYFVEEFNKLRAEYDRRLQQEIDKLEASHKIESERLSHQNSQNTEQYLQRIRENEAGIAEKDQELADSQKEVANRDQIIIDIQQQLADKVQKLVVAQEDISARDQIIQNAESERQELAKRIDDLQAQLQELQTRNIELNDTLDATHAALNEAQEELSKVSEIGYEALRQQFEIECNDLVEQKRVVEAECASLRTQVAELQVQKEASLNTVHECQKYISDYFANIDKQILEKKMALQDTGTPTEDTGSTENTDCVVIDQTTVTPFVIRGKKANDFSLYTDLSEDYLDLVVDNMRAIGARGNVYVEQLGRYFYGILKAGLCPVLVGYGSRGAAYAFVSSLFGELPDTISIPAGFSDTNQLAAAINQAETDTVLIEDLFGRMNEEMILPLLRTKSRKILVFTCEDIGCLTYLKEYFYNYFGIIKLGHIANYEASYSYGRYSRLNLAEVVANEKSKPFEIAKKLLLPLGISESYLISRGTILNALCNEFSMKEKDAVSIWAKQVGVMLDPEKKSILSETLTQNGYAKL